MTVGTWAAVSATVVFAAATLVLGWAALRAHGESLRAGVRAERSMSIGDRRGHTAAATFEGLLRRQTRRCVLATLSSMVLMVASAVAATLA